MSDGKEEKPLTPEQEKNLKILEAWGTIRNFRQDLTKGLLEERGHVEFALDERGWKTAVLDIRTITFRDLQEYAPDTGRYLGIIQDGMKIAFGILPEMTQTVLGHIIEKADAVGEQYKWMVDYDGLEFPDGDDSIPTILARLKEAAGRAQRKLIADKDFFIGCVNSMGHDAKVKELLWFQSKLDNVVFRSRWHAEKFREEFVRLEGAIKEFLSDYTEGRYKDRYCNDKDAADQEIGDLTSRLDSLREWINLMHESLTEGGSVKNTLEAVQGGYDYFREVIDGLTEKRIMWPYPLAHIEPMPEEEMQMRMAAFLKKAYKGHLDEKQVYERVRESYNIAMLGN